MSDTGEGEVGLEEDKECRESRWGERGDTKFWKQGTASKMALHNTDQ